jgi:phage FluMu protein Com
MAPKHHPTPLSGGDRKALNKELGKARAMTNILAAQSAEVRAKAETLLQQADRLLCESWNKRMWADGEPVDPSPTIDQAVNGGFPWLEIRCSRCKTPCDVDLAGMKHPPTTFVHDLVSRLRCRKCAKVGRRRAGPLAARPIPKAQRRSREDHCGGCRRPQLKNVTYVPSSATWQRAPWF